MKFPILLSQILRGEWAIDPKLAISYIPFIANLIEGKSLSIDMEEPKLVFTAIDNNGNSYSAYDDAPEGSIALISLKGTMIKEDTWCDFGTVAIAARITEAVNHPNISGIIIIIDSGGGAVNSIQPLIEAIQGTEKPIIGFVDDVAASAAYYFASFLSMIIASKSPSAMVGSIGVMMSFVDVQPFYEKAGYKFHTIYAPESTHKNLPFENALKGDYTLLQSELLSPLAQTFQNTVRENRKGKLDESVDGILAGKMFFAKDALAAGLIDKIGNLETAIQMAIELSAKQTINNFNFI